MPKGGKREGAGRPPSNKTRLVKHVTQDERKAIEDLLSRLRESKTR